MVVNSCIEIIVPVFNARKKIFLSDYFIIMAAGYKWIGSGVICGAGEMSEIKSRQG